MLEVIFLRYADPGADVEFTIDEAPTEVVFLPLVRSFIRESPLDTIHIGLFNRLSLPLTCDVTFTVTIAHPMGSPGPWIRGFTAPRDSTYLSEVKAVKTTVYSRTKGTPHATFRTEFLNSKNMRISLNRRSRSSGYRSFSLMTRQLLELLESGGMIHSIEILHFEQHPVNSSPGHPPVGFTGTLRMFSRLRTLVLLECNSVLFLENPSPPLVWCPSVEKLVIFQLPRHSREAAESNVLNRVRNIAVSRRTYGTPIKTITLFFEDVERLSQACRGLIEELRGCVESMEVENWVGI